MKTAIVGVPIPAEVRAALEKAQGGLHTGDFVNDVPGPARCGLWKTREAATRARWRAQPSN